MQSLQRYTIKLATLTVEQWDYNNKHVYMTSRTKETWFKLTIYTAHMQPKLYRSILDAEKQGQHIVERLENFRCCKAYRPKRKFAYSSQWHKMSRRYGKALHAASFYTGYCCLWRLERIAKRSMVRSWRGLVRKGTPLAKWKATASTAQYRHS